MKNLNLRYFIIMALSALMIAGCKDEDFDNYKIQSVDNHGKDQKVISTAVTATSNSEFLVNAVVPSKTEEEFKLIPIVLNSRVAASEDIHVKLVPALDSLESYNEEHETDYVMAGSPGTPPFTLVEGLTVTIPKGSYVGYLKIKAVSFDYLGAKSAFAYRIESVQEPGYTISGNHNFGITVLMAKNPYDGLYHATGALVGHPSLSGPIDLEDVEFVTSGENTVIFNAVYGKGGAGGIFGVEIQATIDPVTHLVALKETPNSSAALVLTDPTNSYDPVKKEFNLKYGWGTRVETVKFAYSGSR